MISMLQLWLGCLCGALLGLGYFGGLWWTVCRLPHTRHVWRTYFGSLILRLALILTSFYLVLTLYGWKPLAATLLGFVISRLVLIQIVGRVPLIAPPTEQTAP